MSGYMPYAEGLCHAVKFFFPGISLIMVVYSYNKHSLNCFRISKMLKMDVLNQSEKHFL